MTPYPKVAAGLYLGRMVEPILITRAEQAVWQRNPQRRTARLAWLTAGDGRWLLLETATWRSACLKARRVNGLRIPWAVGLRATPATYHGMWVVRLAVDGCASDGMLQQP